MKRTIIITGIVVVLAIIIMIVIGRITKRKEVANLYVEAKRGQFDIIVSTTGELEAENSEDIMGPDFRQSRSLRAMDIKITDMVPEGTEVKQGDYIATLDRTQFDNSLKDEREKLIQAEDNLEVKMLDTAVTLSGLRDNIKNLRYSVEEAQITLQESKYEPPTTIRQAEIALDRAQRSLDQTIKTYGLKVEQAKTEMRTIRKNLSDQQQRVNDFETILAKFVITAPSDGMVIYKRDRMNNKRKIGSSISPWDNVVATLPDMSTMISKTYVNEIDVSKVKPGQKVELMVDAFPEKSYTGSVISVANIGEQLPNTDAKVFEVQIKVDGTDPILRPSMTTGNKIITKTIDDVVYIPLESVQAGTDSIPFVYMKNGNRQIVLLGESNENNVIVEQGLKEGDVLYLSTPAKPEGFRLTGGNLIAVNRERAKAKREEEERIRQEAAKSRQKMMPQPGGPMSPEMMQNLRGNFQPGQNGRTGNGGPAGNPQNRAGSQQQPGMNPTASQRNLPERPVGPGQNSPAGSRNPN
ncbi:MAG TPA: HlyD family efflux transporter periplasmic adaptor subunit [Bacteroidales bacterium]|nr:HlyD family efflux transporter periplasmic adaptor subunit [Bacteroidales bacterium]HNR41110.1 HlyD family efflux transporter periplasmic adaptor subunit [Bacteroidales bacterium]HPM17654.1 HlyD family efflux transporter periplasmic adaptor subunit [Bacteroidales bacterium]